MDSKTQNYLSMVGTCVATAQNPAHRPVWDGQHPADFGDDLVLLNAQHLAIVEKAAQWDAATGGAASAKASAEATLENAAYILARACYNHFKKAGDLTSAAKVDYTRTEIGKLRAQELLTQTTAIRTLAQHAAADALSIRRGVTPGRIGALTAALTAYTALMNTPRGQIVNRSAIGQEIETGTGTLLDLLRDLDDLAIQFDSTPAGLLFIEAWKRARIIVHSGGTHHRPESDPGGNKNHEEAGDETAPRTTVTPSAPSNPNPGPLQA